MANPVTSTVKRAPKWAWYVVGGIGLGGAAIQLFRRRDARTAALNTGNPATGQVPLNPSPQGGVIVPPVIMPAQSDNMGAQLVTDAFGFVTENIGSIVQGWQGVAHGWQDVYQPVIDTNNALTQSIIDSHSRSESALLAIAQAGPPPAAVQTPTYAGAAGPAYTPAPPAPPAFADCGHDECHCEGTGANRKCWTRRDHGHCYPNGTRQHVSYEFIKNGC